MMPSSAASVGSAPVAGSSAPSMTLPDSALKPAVAAAVSKPSLASPSAARLPRQEAAEKRPDALGPSFTESLRAALPQTASSAISLSSEVKTPAFPPADETAVATEGRPLPAAIRPIERSGWVDVLQVFSFWLVVSEDTIPEEFRFVEKLEAFVGWFPRLLIATPDAYSLEELAHYDSDLRIVQNILTRCYTESYEHLDAEAFAWCARNLQHFMEVASQHQRALLKARLGARAPRFSLGRSTVGSASMATVPAVFTATSPAFEASSPAAPSVAPPAAMASAVPSAPAPAAYGPAIVIPHVVEEIRPILTTATKRGELMDWLAQLQQIALSGGYTTAQLRSIVTRSVDKEGNYALVARTGAAGEDGHEGPEMTPAEFVQTVRKTAFQLAPEKLRAYEARQVVDAFAFEGDDLMRTFSKWTVAIEALCPDDARLSPFELANRHEVEFLAALSRGDPATNKYAAFFRRVMTDPRNAPATPEGWIKLMKEAPDFKGVSERRGSPASAVATRAPAVHMTYASAAATDEGRRTPPPRGYGPPLLHNHFSFPWPRVDVNVPRKTMSRRVEELVPHRIEGVVGGVAEAIVVAVAQPLTHANSRPPRVGRESPWRNALDQSVAATSAECQQPLLIMTPVGAHRRSVGIATKAQREITLMHRAAMFYRPALNLTSSAKRCAGTVMVTWCLVTEKATLRRSMMPGGHGTPALHLLPPLLLRRLRRQKTGCRPLWLGGCEGLRKRSIYVRACSGGSDGH